MPSCNKAVIIVGDGSNSVVIKRCVTLSIHLAGRSLNRLVRKRKWGDSAATAREIELAAERVRIHEELFTPIIGRAREGAAKCLEDFACELCQSSVLA